MKVDRAVGGGVAMVAAIGTIVVGLAKGLAPAETLGRAVVLAAAGFAVGWLVFGKLGVALVRAAAGGTAGPERGRKPAGARPPAGT